MKTENQPKIIQILIGTQDSHYQGRLIGLGDDGIVYAQCHDSTLNHNVWMVWADNLFFIEGEYVKVK